MMSAARPHHAEPHWSEQPVAVVHGLADTRIKTGEDYETRTLGSFWSLEPSARHKHQGLAFLPSLYHGHDAREHRIQRESGQFVALVGDIDKGDQPLARVEEAVQAIVGDGAYLIHSTAHALFGDMRWRIVMPLASVIPYSDWRDAQEALFDLMGERGIEMDGVTERAGQISFLPNVPAAHGETGEALRGSNGGALYYDHRASSEDAPGLDLSTGSIASAIAALSARRAEDERKRAAIQAEALRRRASNPQQAGDSVIDTFNRSNSLPDMLTGYGYTQSRRDSADWRSRYQTSGSFATRLIGGKWVSLSGSDAANGVGTPCASGCYGDAFDLFLHYEHGGNRNAAWKAACQEQGRERPRQQQSRQWHDDAGHWTGEAANDRDDHFDPGSASRDGEPERRIIKATPFNWRDPATIPPRKWLYGRHLIRKFLSLDIAPGGLGKSSVKIVESLAMTAGLPLLGKDLPEGPLKVWLYNLEDPAEETERRIHAAALHYGIEPSHIADRLFVDSGRDQPICIAEETPDGARIIRPIAEAVVAELRERQIDVLSIDPFVSSHAISENDNRAIDMVSKEWSRIADICDCSINLVHHVRKMNGAEVTAESSRGAVSLIGTARSVVVYNRMTKEEADAAGISQVNRGFYFRTQNDKANLAPPEAADWFRMNNVDLPNGDSVGVACPWTWPDAFAGLSSADLYAVQLAIDAGEWGESVQAKDWAGHAVASALHMNPLMDKHRIKSLLKTWIANKALAVEKRATPKGREKPFIVVGDWVDPATLPTSKTEVG